MKKLLCICALWVGQVAVAADVFVDGQPQPFKFADPLELDATIGGYPIWQGEKKWRLFDVVRRNSGGSATSVPLGDVRVFQTEEKQFVAAMTVSANLAQASASDWTDEPCKREDLLFKASIGGKFKNVNCVTINHIVGYPGNPGGQGAKLFALFKEQGIDRPPTVLQIAFTRYSDNLRRLSFVLSINPELAGFPRETETVWSRNAWHKSQSFNDPEKKRFIDALGVWGLQFAKQMDVAFDKKGDAFASIPSWRSGVDAQSKSDLVKPKVTLD